MKVPILIRSEVDGYESVYDTIKHMQMLEILESRSCFQKHWRNGRESVWSYCL